MSLLPPTAADLAGIDNWLFDLDNTLYPARADLFALIHERMNLYVMQLFGCPPEEAAKIRERHFLIHGTTLAGLVAEHGIDAQAYLDFVHDIPLDRVRPDPILDAALAALPGRCFVFTNGDAHYAGRVLDQLGIRGRFTAIYDILAMDLKCKPHPDAYSGLCRRHSIDPTRALFVDDMARNLDPARALGMQTVWVDNGPTSDSAAGLEHRPDAHPAIDALTPWLASVSQALAATTRQR